MGPKASQMTSLAIAYYSTVYSGADQRKRQSFASLLFVWGIQRWPHKWQVTRKIIPFDDVTMTLGPGQKGRHFEEDIFIIIF